MKPALGALLLGATCIALSPIFVRLSAAGPTATAFWRVALAVPPLWLAAALSRSAFNLSRRSLLAAARIAFAGDLAFWHTRALFAARHPARRWRCRAFRH